MGPPCVRGKGGWQKKESIRAGMKRCVVVRRMETPREEDHMQAKSACRTRVVLSMLVACALFAVGSVAQSVENVVVLNDMAPFSCDPAEMAFWTHWRAGVQMYDGLTYPDADGGVRPHLAESWAVADGVGKVWEFKLRQGALFHDGTEVTAEDVVFSFERMMALGTGAYSRVKAIRAVTALDPYTVQFELDSPISVFPNMIWSIYVVNKDVVLANLGEGDHGDMGDYGVEWLRFHDAGSGPYTLVEHQVNLELRFERFADYFLGWQEIAGGVPVETVRLIGLWEAATAKNLMVNRELDMTYTTFPRQTFAELDAIPGVELVSLNKAHVYGFYLNCQAAPTDDVHFRRALSYAFNYESLLPIWDSAPGRLISTRSPAFNPEAPLYTQDLDKMREELAQSCYSQDTPLIITAPIGDAFFDKMVASLAADLSQAGFNIKVEQISFGETIARCSAAETSGNCIPTQSGPEYPGVDNVLSNWATPGGYAASHWFDDPTLQGMIAQSRETLDEAARNLLYQQIEAYILEQAAEIFVTELDPFRAIQEYLIVNENQSSGIIGAAVNMHDVRIDLEKKAEFLGQ